MKYLVVSSFLAFIVFSGFAQSRDSLNLYMIKGEYRSVIELLDQKPDLNRIEISYLAYALDKTGSSQKAAGKLTEYITDNGFNTELGLQLADICYEAGYLDQSLKYYEMVIRSDSSMTRTYLPLASLYLTFDKNYNAIKLLRFAHQQDSLNVQYMIRLSDAYIASKRLRNADEILRKAYTADPENLKVQRGLVKINYNLGNLAFVQEICKKGMDKYPYDYFFYYFDGMTFYKGGDFKSAAYFLEKAYKRNTSDDNIKKYLGIAYFKTEQYDKSIGLLKRYISDNENSADVAFFLGCALSYTGDNVLALPYLQKAMDLLTPEDKVIAELYLQMGISNRALKLYDLAEQKFDKALEADSTQAVLALFYLGSMYDFDLDNKKQAKLYYQQFIDFLDRSGKKVSENNATYQGAAERRITAITEELFFKEGIEDE
ncbi:tetratricopeptide repeat protein [Saccharicrinis sp. FJH62]|uniref:tetratricopeptide repeat protein n=1 Tax=Saccharicrinis sp. FJH62 TaxID=3344657 RepID=UPI0035D49F3B